MTRETSRFFESRADLTTVGDLDRVDSPRVSIRISRERHGIERSRDPLYACKIPVSRVKVRSGGATGEKSARSREAQFLRELAFIGDTGSRVLFHVDDDVSCSRRVFSENRICAATFLAASAAIAVPIVRRRKKTLVKDAPRPSGRRDQEGASKKVAQTRGGLMALPIALADNLPLVYRPRRNQLCKWLNHQKSLAARNGSLPFASLSDLAVMAD